MTYPTTKIGKYQFQGLSVAGTFTSIACKELDIAFDVGNGPLFLLGRKNIFLTHGHADHAGGLPYILSMKSMSSQPTTKVYVPPKLAEPLDQIVKTWQTIEDHTYDYRIIPTDDSAIPLKNNFFVRRFETFHRVQSNGYTVFEKRKKLKEEFKSADREIILKAKEAGTEINDWSDHPVISFTGDTKIEFWDSCPWIKKSNILFMEVSFIDEKRSIEETREWGHVHIEELLPRIEEFEGEHLVLIHLSARYRPSDLKKLLDARLSKQIRGRVHVFPRT